MYAMKNIRDRALHPRDFVLKYNSTVKTTGGGERVNRNDRGFRAEYTNIPGRQASPAPRGQSQPRPTAQSVRVDRLRPVNRARQPDLRGTPPGQIPIGQRPPVNTRQGQPRQGNTRIQPRQLRINDTRISERVTMRRPAWSGHKPLKRKNTAKRDFLLGLGIGFAIFGTAAIFVVRAILELLV